MLLDSIIGIMTNTGDSLSGSNIKIFERLKLSLYFKSLFFWSFVGRLCVSESKWKCFLWTAAQPKLKFW